MFVPVEGGAGKVCSAYRGGGGYSGVSRHMSRRDSPLDAPGLCLLPRNTRWTNGVLRYMADTAFPTFGGVSSFVAIYGKV